MCFRFKKEEEEYKDLDAWKKKKRKKPIRIVKPKLVITQFQM